MRREDNDIWRIKVTPPPSIVLLKERKQTREHFDRSVDDFNRSFKKFVSTEIIRFRSATNLIDQSIDRKLDQSINLIELSQYGLKDEDMDRYADV